MTLRERLLGRQVCKGLFYKCPCPELVEMAGYSGMDFVVLDQEHSNLSPQDTEGLIRAAECSGLTPIVRTPSPEESHLIHAMDSGARGLIIPGVSSAEQAAAVTRLTKFFPQGMRSMNFGSRAAMHGFLDRAASMERDNRENFTMIMVESVEMVEQIEALCAVDTLDGVFIGPADLSQSMGIPGQTGHPDLLAHVRRVCRTAHAAGKFVGAFAATRQAAANFIGAGAELIVGGTEMSLLKGALIRANAELDEVIAEQAKG